MPRKLIPFPTPPRKQPGPETELEPYRILVEIGCDRFAIDVTTTFTVTELPSEVAPLIPIQKSRYRKRQRQTGGNRQEPGWLHNHDPVEELVLIPAAKPTHAPAVELVAYRGRLAEAQELRFELRLFVHT